MAKTLVNFLVEEADLRRFDGIAESMGRNRTSILTEMMRDFCAEKIIVLEQRNLKLQQLDRALAENKILQEGINSHQLTPPS
jgi:hypothetical protein